MDRIPKMEAEIIALREIVQDIPRQIRITKWIVIGCAAFNLILKLLSTPIPYQHPIPPQSVGSNNAVQIGANPKPESKRTFLTVKDVAEKEGVSERTVISAISQGRISPQPERDGRAWTVAADYRFLPIMAAVSEPTQKTNEPTN